MKWLSGPCCEAFEGAILELAFSTVQESLEHTCEESVGKWNCQILDLFQMFSKSSSNHAARYLRQIDTKYLLCEKNIVKNRNPSGAF
jgi:hypothetical protein